MFQYVCTDTYEYIFAQIKLIQNSLLIYVIKNIFYIFIIM